MFAGANLRLKLVYNCAKVLNFRCLFLDLHVFVTLIHFCALVLLPQLLSVNLIINFLGWTQTFRASLPYLRCWSSTRVWAWITHWHARVCDNVAVNPIWCYVDLIWFSVVRLCRLHWLQLLKRRPLILLTNHSWTWRTFAPWLHSHVICFFILNVYLNVSSIVLLLATKRHLIDLLKTMSLQRAIILLINSRDITQAAVCIWLVQRKCLVAVHVNVLKLFFPARFVFEIFSLHLFKLPLKFFLLSLALFLLLFLHSAIKVWAVIIDYRFTLRRVRILSRWLLHDLLWNFSHLSRFRSCAYNLL